VLALRFCYLLALVVWMGGIAVIGGLAAPATFEVMQARHGEQGRVLAGAVVGEVLRRFHIVTYVAGALLFASLLGMKLLGPRPVAFGMRMAVITAMLAITLFSGLWVSGRIEAIRREVPGPVSALPEEDPRRAAFGRLHGVSTILMFVNLLGGLMLVYWEASEQ
jgi:hypothetical protein